MGPELGSKESLKIDARMYLAGYAGMTGMLTDLFQAHEALQGRAGAGPAAYTPLLNVANDVIHLVYKACTRIAGPCNAALATDSYDPRLAMAVTDTMVTSSDLLERVSARIELPINQWVTEITAQEVTRDYWPSMWTVAVWIGAMMHYIEDAAVVMQAHGQFLTYGSFMETRRAGAEWLNKYGVLAALDEYRQANPRDRVRLADDVSEASAYALHMLGQTAKSRAEKAAAVADCVTHANALDARDIVHLGIHSQAALSGGVFLSHRGQDAKRPLMDCFRSPRREIFLDVWSQPSGDTNRRFLWRNLAAAAEMHAFVTANYAASAFCIKELEAWGLLSLARGHDAGTAPGHFFVIGAAPTRETESDLCAWTRVRRQDTTLERAMDISASVVANSGAIGTRVVHSDDEKQASDEFNRALMTSSLLRGAEAHLVALSREPLDALMDLLRNGLSLLSRGDEIPPAAVESVVALIPAELPSSGAGLVTLLREINAQLVSLLRSHPTIQPVVRCVVFALVAVTAMSAHIIRHWDGGSPDDVALSLMAFSKFGATIDKVRDQFANWCVALATSRFNTEDDEELLAGLLLGLLPIDHAAQHGGVRVTDRFAVPSASTMAEALDGAGLGRRRVQVICSASPTTWQRIAVIGAMSSFTSRSFMFVDIAGSGALRARVGGLLMEDFPHVTVARLEDLPEP